jgi:hypothetical protein
MLSAMAEDDRLRIVSRTREGRNIAREKGVKFGRKPTLTPHQGKKHDGGLPQASRRATWWRLLTFTAARLRGHSHGVVLGTHAP